tara:strand:- start:1898 stop:2242 length:345 start_codon:yes stop_codon:yes gene_type:complete
MSKCIECDWKKNGIVTVNPDGQVWPCCYLQNVAYYDQITNDPHRFSNNDPKKNKWIFKEYYDNKEDLNILNKPLEEILQHKWFTETLPKSWEDYDNTTLKQCRLNCTVEKKEEL